MPNWKNFQQSNIYYFITTTINNYIPILKKDTYKNIILDSLKYYSNKYDYQLIAFVIMPEHIHFIVKGNENTDLHNFMRDFKKYTSKEIIKDLTTKNQNKELSKFKNNTSIKSNYKIWMKRYRSVPIYSKAALRTKIDYIHKNPLKRNLVESPADYKYSSFNSYYKANILT